MTSKTITVNETAHNLSFLNATKVHVLIGVALAIVLIWGGKNLFFSNSRFDHFIERVTLYSKEPTEDNYLILKSVYDECWNSWNCRGQVSSQVENGDFKTQLLFDSLVNNNRLDFAVEVGFFSDEGVWGRTAVWKVFTLNYQGTNYEVNRLKAIHLTRIRRYKSAYETLIKMFAENSNSWNKNIVASMIRGLLKNFNCKNDMVVWESYSIHTISYEDFVTRENNETPLSNDQLKVARAAFDRGGIPELQDTCSLKYYKL